MPILGKHFGDVFKRWKNISHHKIIFVGKNLHTDNDEK
jgi:hypothetical protein